MDNIYLLQHWVYMEGPRMEKNTELNQHFGDVSPLYDGPNDFGIGLVVMFINEDTSKKW